MNASLRRPTLLAVALSLSVASLIGTAGAAQASFPSATNGRIIFDGYDPSTSLSEIYSINPDGSAMQQLTSGSNNLAPDVSADGTKIAFTSNRSGNEEIWTMNADGSNPVQITDDQATDLYPSFSPDGTQIAYRMTTPTNTGDIFVVASDADAAGTPTQLTSAPGLDSAPEWSNDGQSILFHSSRDDADPANCSQCVQSVYSMNADGSNQMQLVYVANGRARFPNWSPDDSQIVYEQDSTVDGSGTAEIYTADADGSNQTPFAPTSGAFNDEAPDFSPDGTQLVWEANGNMQIAPLDGSSAVQDIATPGVTVGSIDWGVTAPLVLTSKTTLTSPKSSSIYGQSVTFTAKVTTAGGVTTAPTGTVTFTVNGTQVGSPVALTRGTATRTISSAPSGADTVVATYNGDSQHSPTSASTSLQVSDAQTSTTLSVADGATITYGQPVSATVKAVTPSKAAIPGSTAGTVTIDGTVTTGLHVTRSKITVPAGLLTAGTHQLMICYQGVTNIDGSCSPTITITVDQAMTTTTLGLKPNPSTVGQKVTLTAHVMPRPTGTITFYDGTTALGTVNVANGGAFINVKFTTSGTHPITAVYNGDGNYQTSTSVEKDQQVN